MLQRISHDEQNSWQNALLNLLETYHVNVTTLDTSIPINDYLDQAVGFQSAYSFPACSPPRSIVYCTTSLIQHYKCSWLQEAASAYGIEPNIQCIRAESIDRCMDDTKHQMADVVLVDQDTRIRAEREFNLKPVLYEFAANPNERFMVVAIVHSSSDIHSFEDLRGKRACFPAYESGAYLSVWDTLRNLSLVNGDERCGMYNYFARDSCTWQGQTCDAGKYMGEEGAVRCLADGQGDVAFVDAQTFGRLTAGQLDRTGINQLKNVRLL